MRKAWGNLTESVRPLEIYFCGVLGGSLMIRESAEVLAELVREYPEETVLGRLERLYKAELDRVIVELDRLLPSYRRRVSRRVYCHDRAELKLVQTRLQADSLNLQELEAALKCLLKKQLEIVKTLKEDGGVPSQERFRLECRATGTVKAYKRMTAAQAYSLNLALAAEDSFCRWTPLVKAPAGRGEVCQLAQARLESSSEAKVEFKLQIEPEAEKRVSR